MVRTLAITLLRHGLTSENIEKKYVGWSDVPLCEKGKIQLEEYKRVGYPRGDLYFVSDLRRCKETFHSIYENCGSIPIFDDNFREFNFGEWELKTYEQLKDNAHYKRWLDNSRSEQVPNGEDFLSFEKRVIDGWTKATANFSNENIQHIVIVSHGGPIKLLLEQYAPYEKVFWDWQINHGQGYTLTTTMERLRRKERCILLQEVPFKEKEAGSVQPTI